MDLRSGEGLFHKLFERGHSCTCACIRTRVWHRADLCMAFSTPCLFKNAFQTKNDEPTLQELRDFPRSARGHCLGTTNADGCIPQDPDEICSAGQVREVQVQGKALVTASGSLNVCNNNTHTLIVLSRSLWRDGRLVSRPSLSEHTIDRFIFAYGE